MSDIPEWKWVQQCTSFIDIKVVELWEVLYAQHMNEMINGGTNPHVVTNMYIKEIAQAHAQLAIYGFAYDGVEFSDVPRVEGAKYYPPSFIQQTTDQGEK